MKNRVAIICEYNIFPDRIGGMDRFFVAFDEALKNEGYTVEWFFKDVKIYEFYNELTIQSAQGSNLEHFFMDYISTGIRFDLVISHFLSPISSFHKKIKYALPNSRIITVDHNSRPENGYGLVKSLRLLLKGFIYGKHVNKLVGVSDYTVSMLKKEYPYFSNHKFERIYNGIDCTLFKEKSKNLEHKNSFRFITVAFLRESKGIQDLIEAVQILKRSIGDKIQFDIYGETGPYASILNAMVEKYQLREIIHFKGSVNDIHLKYKDYDYLILPTYMECFNLSFLESLASNVPVITTDVGGNLELIENNINGFVFKPRDIIRLSQIIDGIVENKLTVEGDVNSLIYNRFSLNQMVQNHLNLVLCI